MTKKIVSALKRKRLESRKGTVTTSMILPRALHARAMHTALNLNWTLGEVARTALADWLDRHEATSRTTRGAGQ